MRRTPRDTCLGLFAGICLLACLVPSACFRLRHGQPPLSDEKVRGSSAVVKEGASGEAVVAALGTPHKREPNYGPKGGE